MPLYQSACLSLIFVKTLFIQQKKVIFLNEIKLIGRYYEQLKFNLVKGTNYNSCCDCFSQLQLIHLILQLIVFCFNNSIIQINIALLNKLL